MPYKDLTWEDIRLIVEIADSVLDNTEKKELLAFGAQGYYMTVLDRVTRCKEYDANKGTNAKVEP